MLGNQSQSSRIWLVDSSRSALSGTAVPTSLSLASFDFMRFDLVIPDGTVFGTLTSLTQVPEPGIAALLTLLPLAGLVAVRRARRA